MPDPQPILAAGVDQADIPAVYGRVAWMYDAWAALTESRARRRCLELARVRDGEAVLEVAVGTGLTFEALLRANPHGRTAGVDLTPAMLARAERRARRTGLRFELTPGDAHRLAFPDRSFDLVVNNYMFDLLPEADFAAVLGEMRRVLRPGGRLVLVNMAQGELRRHRFYEWVYRRSPALMGGCRGVSLLPHVSAAGFVAARRERVQQAGFPSELIYAERPA